MAADPQMYDHTLTAVKGWPNPYAVDRAADLDATVTNTTVVTGMVVSIDPTSNDFVLGVPAPTSSGTLHAVPGYFVWQGGADFDVLGSDGNIVGATATGWRAHLSGISCISAAELETTEFVAATYTHGDLLTAAASGGSAGKLTKATATGAITVVGIASGGTRTNAQGKTVLRFLTTFVPKFS